MKDTRRRAQPLGHRPHQQRDARSGELRRRAIVLFTDGEDNASLVSDDQVLDIAKKSEVAIYAITLRSQRPQDRMRQAFSQAEYLMSALGRETGGRAYFPTALSELDSVYDRIALELGVQALARASGV